MVGLKGHIELLWSTLPGVAFWPVLLNSATVSGMEEHQDLLGVFFSLSSAAYTSSLEGIGV